MEVSIDASELEGMSQEQLRKQYDSANRGSAGVPGSGNREDFSDMVAKEMAKKKQKLDHAKDRGKKEKEFKF